MGSGSRRCFLIGGRGVIEDWRFLVTKLGAMNENTPSLACSSEGKWRFLALSSPRRERGELEREVAGWRAGGAKLVLEQVVTFLSANRKQDNRKSDLPHLCSTSTKRGHEMPLSSCHLKRVVDGLHFNSI